ncbi:hypothetical protein L1987_77122 [Smallanthus sonchifolius]|uniref:Uncharacterized protein n=1 Tax=Smallanthus sonchifolius TaxID=185202 RepID=A0ACB8Z8V1_9ASTR|nr:hypothetical protein L1987_77122 [Smallanthus sonchifolius]
MASGHLIPKRKVVVLSLSQCHRHGWGSSYSVIAWVAALDRGTHEDVDYSFRSKTPVGQMFGMFTALGDVAFAYAGHNVVLEIQATIPSTPEKPSKGPMWLGCFVAYIIVAICYFPVAIIGYYIFGNKVDDNILITLDHPRWLIAMANMFVIIHVIGGYQIYSMPVYDMIETFLVKSMKFQPSSILRFTVRTSFVAITTFIAITFPFFGGLLGFFGGFALAPTTYYCPCIIWLIVKKPERWSITWCINWICIVIGVLLMILAPLEA